MRKNDGWALAGWAAPPEAATALAYYERLASAALAARDSTPAGERAARYILDKLVWGVTTVTDTHKLNLRYLSEGATRIFDQLAAAAARRELSAAAPELLKQLRHEHVVERREIVERLLAGDATALASAVACVVTVDEHRRLGGSRKSGWERYGEAGVRVWDRQDAAWIDGRGIPYL
jgi:hypothetical protein